MPAEKINKEIYFIQGCELYLCKPEAMPADKKDLPENCYQYTCSEEIQTSDNAKCEFSAEPSNELSMTVDGGEYTVFDTVYNDTITTYTGLTDPAVGFIYDDFSGSGGKVTKSLYPLDLEYYTTNIKQCDDGVIKTAQFPYLPPEIKKAPIDPALITQDKMVIPVFTFSGKTNMAQKITTWLNDQKSSTIEPAVAVVIYHTEKMKKAAEKLKKDYLKADTDVVLQTVPDNIYKIGVENPDEKMKKIRGETLTVAYIPKPLKELKQAAQLQIYSLYLAEAGLSDKKAKDVEFTEEEVE